MTIERPPEYGGNLHVKKYEDLETLFTEEKLHPVDLKTAIVAVINTFFDGFRSEWDAKAQKAINDAAFPVVKGGKKK